MTAPTIDGAAILRDIEQAEAERVRVADISRRIGWDRASQSRAVAAGALEAAPGRGPGNPYTITRDEALILLLAAVFAVAAGIAIVQALRGLKGAGVTGSFAAEVLHAKFPT